MLINNEKWLWPLTRDEQTDVTYSNKGVQQMIINMHEHESQRNSFSHVTIKRKESKSKTFLRSRAIQFRCDQNEERWLWNDEREIHFHCDDRFRCCCSCLWRRSLYRSYFFFAAAAAADVAFSSRWNAPSFWTHFFPSPSLISSFLRRHFFASIDVHSFFSFFFLIRLAQWHTHTHVILAVSI